MELEVEVVIRH